MAAETATVVEARSLTKVFGQGAAAVHALRGVDLSVQAGELLMIMGPSGSGKTTLLTIIGGLLRPTSGTVRVGEVEITALPERRLSYIRSKTVGFIFQNPNLLSALTVQEQVEIALNIGGVTGQQAKRRASELLERLGIGNRLFYRPDPLSGGEKQRVAIARALANNPVLILADEPTANLDSQRGREAVKLLRDIAKEQGKTVIVVTHDTRIREIADRVLWLEDGRFRDVGRLSRDPICGMLVELQGSPITLYRGESYYFCSRGCQREFEGNPEMVIAK